MKSGGWSRQIAKDSRWSSHSASQIFIIFITIISLLIGVVLGLFGPYAWAIVIGSMILAVIIAFRQDELGAAFILAIHLNVDWYLGLRVVSLVLTLLLLCFYYVFRSPQRPWVMPRSLWLWFLFLGLSIIPAVRGATDLYDTLFYYPNLILGALLMFWLGTIIARNPASIRLFFRIFSFYSMLIAIHTIIQSRTGIFLFGTTHLDTQIAQAANNHLPGMLNVNRVGSFLIDPDWAGTFFAMTLFIPLGLFIESSSQIARIFYLLEAILICVALLFTYSTGSWIAASVSAVIFMLLLGGMHYRIQFLVCLSVAAIIVLFGFSSHVNLLLQHSTDPLGLSARMGAWQTALKVINAFPLTGVGLSEQSYLLNSIPYIVPTQLIPLAHPHNSYLEWAAMAGLPVLVVFVALLLFNIKSALQIWALSDPQNRCLLAIGLATVFILIFNSFSVNAWTLPPLSAIGWVIFGMLSSPLHMKRQVGQITNKKKDLISSLNSDMEWIR